MTYRDRRTEALAGDQLYTKLLLRAYESNSRREKDIKGRRNATKRCDVSILNTEVNRRVRKGQNAVLETKCRLCDLKGRRSRQDSLLHDIGALFFLFKLVMH